MEVRFREVVVRRAERVVLAVPGLALGREATVALLGPNGAGKTTALRLMAGLERPAAGVVLLDGEPAAVVGPKRVAFAFQRAVFMRGTVRENMELALRLRGVGAAERRRRIGRVAELCGIGHLLERDARRLSGGEAQRVNLGRALALEAGLVLLDEPLSGLDGPSRESLLADLPAMLAASNATVVLVTHDRDEALLLARELVVLLAGQVEAHGPAGDVFRRPPTLAVAGFLGYTVLGREAVRPGALVVGDGERTFRLRLQRVVDLGTHLAAEGRAGEAVVRARLPAGETVPAAGDEVAAGAPREAVLRYDDAGRLVE